MQVTLESTSTIYMDGTAVYNLKYTDKPGIITTLVLDSDEHDALVKLLKTSR